ncbi:hypothetical protein Mapa_003527 [Marchantia paleacea]|nr:hypothetical protein Mapa_003527 [Marchantia paleacea]
MQVLFLRSGCVYCLILANRRRRRENARGSRVEKGCNLVASHLSKIIIAEFVRRAKSGGTRSSIQSFAFLYQSWRFSHGTLVRGPD